MRIIIEIIPFLYKLWDPYIGDLFSDTNELRIQTQTQWLGVAKEVTNIRVSKLIVFVLNPLLCLSWSIWQKPTSSHLEIIFAKDYECFMAESSKILKFSWSEFFLLHEKYIKLNISWFISVHFLVSLKEMTLIPIYLLIQLAQCRLQADYDELIKQIPHEELLRIRENYCRSVKSFSENLEFCQTAQGDLPDEIPSGFLLLILSIIWECFQKLSLP